MKKFLKGIQIIFRPVDPEDGKNIGRLPSDHVRKLPVWKRFLIGIGWKWKF